MDVTIEAAPIAAEANMLEVICVAVSGFQRLLVALSQSGVASVVHVLKDSIVTRGPNYILRKELVPAAA